MHLPTFDNIKKMSEETLIALCEEIEYRLQNNLLDELTKQLLQAFLDYGRLTIMGRAFPKVEDGLKPVHRRILYAMNDLSLTPTSPHKKSARIVGNIIGLYHAHGDKSVYDAMVRMAQDFSLRAPLIEGQGNFGTIEGDDPASMRYCVTGNTLIKTANGLFKIKDLVSDSTIQEQNLNIEVFSLGNKINNASKFFNSGKHNIKKIVSKKGYSISGSYNHPILTLIKDENGKPFLFWKTLENITKEDYIVIDRNNLKINKRKHLLDLFTNKGSFIFNKEKQYNEIYFNLEKEEADETQIFLLSYGIYSEQIDLGNNKIKLFLGGRINSELFINRIWLNKKDFKFEYAKSKIPFLNDYIKNKYKNCLSLSQFFEKLEIDNYQDINTYLFVNGILNQFDKEDKALINLLRENYYLFDQVKDIIELPEEEVYSIKVDNDCHSFIGNGIINHNTEATVTKAGYNFFKDLDKNVVDFVPNYDETTIEPLVLPVKFPNLVINGTSGIAVGMTSVIPPHNPIEVIETAKYLVNVRKGKEKFCIDTILSLLPGPDFPTGGILYNTESMKDIFEKGVGRMKLKAKHSIEQTKKKESIVITEIPYMVEIPTIFNKLKEISNNPKNDKNYEIFQNSISAVRNESSGKDGIRIVIDLKVGVDSELIWNQIVKAASLDKTISYIPNVLNLENKPEEMSLRKMFESFIDFRLSVILKKYLYIKKEKEDELEIIQGYLKAMDILDEIIFVIRNAENEQEPVLFLLEKGFSERQTKSILNLRLFKLSKLEKLKLKDDESKLLAVISNALKMIESDTLKYNEILKDLDESKELFIDVDRKTNIDNSVSVLSATDLVKKEECMVYFTDIGYVFREPVIKDKRIKSKFELIENDFLINSFYSDSHSYLFFITNKGNIFGTKAFNIIQDKSIFVNNLFELQEGEHIIKCLEAQDLEGYDLIFGTKQGYIKRTALSEYSGALRKTGVLGTKLEDGDELSFIYLSNNPEDEVFVFNSEGKIIRFSLTEVSSVGRNARGVISMRTDGHILGGYVGSVSKDTYMISISELGYIKSESLINIPIQKRAGKGVYIYKESAKAGSILDGKIISDNSDLLLKLSSENKRYSLSDLETKAVIGSKLLKFSKTEKFLKSLVVPIIPILDETNS